MSSAMNGARPVRMQYMVEPRLIDIAGRADPFRVSIELFGGHERRRADRRPGGGQVLGRCDRRGSSLDSSPPFVHEPWLPPVQNDRLTVRPEHHVGGLDIAV